MMALLRGPYHSRKRAPTSSKVSLSRDHVRRDAGDVGDEGHDGVVLGPDQLAEGVGDLQAAAVQAHGADLDDAAALDGVVALVLGGAGGFQIDDDDVGGVAHAGAFRWRRSGTGQGVALVPGLEQVDVIGPEGQGQLLVDAGGQLPGPAHGELPAAQLEVDQGFVAQVFQDLDRGADRGGPGVGDHVHVFGPDAQ